MTNCPIRRKLAEEFAIATRLYSEAVVALTNNQTLTPRNEFEKLRLAKEEKRQRSETERVAFNAHVDSHGCVSGDDFS